MQNINHFALVTHQHPNLTKSGVLTLTAILVQPNSGYQF